MFLAVFVKQVRDGCGISLCQGDESVTGQSLHHDSTSIQWLSFFKDLSSY